MPEPACPFCAAPGLHAVLGRLRYSAGELPLYACAGCGTRFFTSVAAMRHVLDWVPGPTLRVSLEVGEALATAAGQLAPLVAPPGSRALHLGSGLGVAVDMAVRVRGWRAYGFETGGRAEEAMRLFGEDRLFNEEIDEDTLPEGVFDVILATHVLERLARPRAFLAALRTRLREGGMLLLDVMDGAQLTAGMDEAGLTLRSAPGMNRVLPTAQAVVAALGEEGFTGLRVETRGPYLRVVARLGAAVPEAASEAALLHDYARAVLDSAAPGTALWNGAANVALAQGVAAGDLAGAYAVFERIAAAWGGLDMTAPDTLPAPPETFLADAPPSAFAAPLCLGPVLRARAALALASPEAGPVQVLRWMRAAYRAAVGAQRFLQGYTLHDAGLAETILVTRQGIADQLAALVPSLAPDLAVGLARPSGTALDALLRPAALAPDHAAQRFVDAVAGQRPAEAARWARALPDDVEALSPWPVLAADVLYCRGVLALTAQADPVAARRWFDRMAAFCARHPALADREAQARHHAALAGPAFTPIANVAMDIVNNCNLRCPFCVYDYAGRNRTQVMADETFDAALRLLPFVQPGGFWLSCLHEPTLHPRFADFIARVPADQRGKLFFTTNLSKRMPDSYFALLAGSGMSHINISLESLRPALFERMRKGARFNIFMENWDALLAACAAAAVPPPELRYNVMAYRSNLSEVPELAAHLLAARRAALVEVRYTFDAPHIPQEFRQAEYLRTEEWAWLTAALAGLPADRLRLLPPPGGVGYDPATPAPPVPARRANADEEPVWGAGAFPTRGGPVAPPYNFRIDWDGRLTLFAEQSPAPGEPPSIGNYYFANVSELPVRLDDFLAGLMYRQDETATA